MVAQDHLTETEAHRIARTWALKTGLPARTLLEREPVVLKLFQDVVDNTTSTPSAWYDLARLHQWVCRRQLQESK